jgi:hypothetical protein
MGAKYNWYFLNFHIEFTPFSFLRVSRKHRDGYWHIIIQL